MPIKFEKDYVVLGIFLHVFLTLTVLLFYARSLFHGDYYSLTDPIFAFFYILFALAIAFVFIFYYCRLHAETKFLGLYYNIGCFMILYTNWFLWQIAGKATVLDAEEFFFIGLIFWILSIGVHSFWGFKKKKTDIKGMKKDEIFE